MAEIELRQCPCGGTPREALSENRKKRQEELKATLAESSSLQGQSARLQRELSVGSEGTEGVRKRREQAETAEARAAELQQSALEAARKGQDREEILEDALAELQEAARLRREIKQIEAGGGDVKEQARKLYLSSPKTKQYLERQLAALGGGTHEVSCPDCGAFVHSPDEEQARVTWNKAVDKVPTLGECCTNGPRTVKEDADGMVIYRCDGCGRRRIPFGGEL